MKNLFMKLLAFAMLFFSVSASAAVTYDEALGFGGTIDTTAYSTAIPLVIAVIGLVIATTLGIRALKGAKSA